jgi:hypothetical protein
MQALTNGQKRHEAGMGHRGRAVSSRLWDTLPGLHPENKRKTTGTPTAERLLHAFAGVSLTIIQSATGEDILRRITPLSGGQESILQRLGLGTHLYRQLTIQNRGS